jgi:F420-dependent oxidoreductase-like protein
MTPLKLGIMPWTQATDWAACLDIARRVDALGYDGLWSCDHLYAAHGDPRQPTFEAYTTLAAWATVTERATLGLMVGAVPFRNPGLVAKSITTIDHMSGGRAICGLGAAWFELERAAHGIDFGSGMAERLDWLDEATGIVRALLAGETVTHHGPHYDTEQLVLLPRPVQARLPIMIGGSGERKTLRTVARHADMWNTSGGVERLRHKDDVLRRHCAEIGRDSGEIERTAECMVVIRDTPAAARRAWEELLNANRTPLAGHDDEGLVWRGTPEQVAEKILERRALGFHHFISEQPAPFDIETIERLVGEVKPMVEAG